MRDPHRKFLSLGNHFFERLKTADSSTACGTSTLKSLLSLGPDAPHVHLRLRKCLSRCTLDCGFQTSESPALRGFVGGSQALATAALYLVLKSNGLHRSKNLPVKFDFSLKTVPANIAKKLPPQRCFKPLFIPIFNFSRKRPTFAFTSESGYTPRLSEKNRTQRLTGRNRGALDGGAIITLGAFRTFANLPGPGVLQKNAESLRNSDALMRVAVPRRRGPAGLRDLFAIL